MDPAGPWVDDIGTQKDETDFATLVFQLLQGPEPAGSGSGQAAGAAAPAAATESTAPEQAAAATESKTPAQPTEASMAEQPAQFSESAPPPAQPTSVFARPKAAAKGKGKKGAALANVESVFLAGCSEYLMSGGRGFSLSVPVQTQQPTVGRTTGKDECGASKLALHFVPMEGAPVLPIVRKGTWPHSLLPDAKKIALDPGGWAIYASRQDAEVGYLVGRIYATSSLTPLRARLLSIAQQEAAARQQAAGTAAGGTAAAPRFEPWLRATWAGGPFRLEPISEALSRSDYWHELRTAAAANALWLAKAPAPARAGTGVDGAGPAAGRPLALGRLMTTDDGNGVALPPGTVVEQMVRRYGPAGRYLVPDFQDWQGVNQHLHICLAPRYEAPDEASDEGSDEGPGKAPDKAAPGGAAPGDKPAGKAPDASPEAAFDANAGVLYASLGGLPRAAGSAVVAPASPALAPMGLGLDVGVAAAGKEAWFHVPAKALPAGSACVRLASLTAPLAFQAGGTAISGQVCLKRRASVMTAFGLKAGAELDEPCVPLATSATKETTRDFIIATTGDELRFEGTGGAQLFACTDNQCVKMPAKGESLRLAKPGLVEIRSAANATAVNSTQGITLLRFGVIDPGTQWHPVGLYSYEKPPPANRWTTLEHDEDHVFTYVRRKQALDFRFSASPTLAAVWNRRIDLPSQMTEQIPVVTRVSGTFSGPKPSTLVAVATRSHECPEEPSAKFRQNTEVDPDEMLVDQTFYVHLAQYHGEDKPYRCISRAQFRVVENWSMPLTADIRVGLIGDTQMMLFAAPDPALGLALPMAYGYWRWVYGFGLDASLSLTAAINLFEHAYVSRLGLGLSAAVGWGLEEHAPRLVSAGGMLHLATGTEDDQPIASVLIGINLSTLIDLAGGR